MKTGWLIDDSWQAISLELAMKMKKYDSIATRLVAWMIVHRKNQMTT